MRQDAAQHAWSKAWAKRGTITQPRCFFGWLRRIAINRCHDERRKLSRACQLDAGYDAPGLPVVADSDSEDDRLRRRQAVRVAVASLPDLQRRTVTAYYLDGLDYVGVSARLGIPVGTVRSRLNRSRAMLARILSDDDISNSGTISG